MSERKIARNFSFPERDHKRLKALSAELGCNDTDLIKYMLRLFSKADYKKSLKAAKALIDVLEAKI